jgi:hypothetical protein
VTFSRDIFCAGRRCIVQIGAGDCKLGRVRSRGQAGLTRRPQNSPFAPMKGRHRRCAGTIGTGDSPIDDRPIENRAMGLYRG